MIIVLVLILTIGITDIVNSINFRNNYVEALKTNSFTIGKELKMQLERLLSLNLSIDEILDYDTQCRQVVKEYPMLSFAAVTDMNGKFIYHSDSTVEDGSYCNSVLVKVISEGNDRVVVYKEKNRKHYGFVIPVSDGQVTLGAIVLELPQDAIDSKVLVPFAYSLLISFVFFIISILLITMAIARWITTPLNVLDQATQSIIRSGTEASARINVQSSDENGRLSNSFNKMSEALQKTTVSKVYVDRIIASITDALYVIDAEMKICTINEASAKMTGYADSELLGQVVTILFGPDQIVPFMGDNLAGFLASGKLHNHETVFMRKDGQKMPVLLSCSVMDDASGNVKSIVITAKDITDRKLIEDALVSQTRKLTRSNTELKEFVYIASHDLQEPLRKMCAFSDRVINKYSSVLDDNGKDYLERIINAGVRMQTLINDLLSYSRVTTKAKAFNTVELNKIADDVVSDLQIRIEQTNGTVDVGLLPTIEAEPTQMRQLFQNMIGNGLKFHRPDTPPQIKVYATIRGQKTENSWEDELEICDLTFQDNGIGIEEQYHKRIFGVFQRLHGKDEYEGTGVGLAICQKIVEQHNGEIKVESTMGVGTKFILSLPVKQKKHGDEQNEN